MKTISTVIIKPTKGCTADCSYCSAPDDDTGKWSIDDFKMIFNKLKSRLHPNATFIWHGGEPMMLGIKFYEDAFSYSKIYLPGVKFSIQTNILGYSSKWKSIFKNIFKGSISTSWDPDKQYRTMKGNPELYERIYQSRFSSLLKDGFIPKVISTFNETSSDLMFDTYKKAIESDKIGMTYDIKLNYRYPAGRSSQDGELILPSTYSQNLIEIYNKWISDLPNFVVSPLDQMFLSVIGSEAGRCPWTKSCTGKIIGIEPNFDIYNCGDFADLGDKQFKFGNLKKNTIEECLTSRAAKMLFSRKSKTPKSCQNCIHFTECDGGCMRDSILYEHGLYGKFHYCESWQEIFSRIKESILSGEADGAILKYKRNPEKVKTNILLKLKNGLQDNKTNMRRSILSLNHIPYFPENQFRVDFL